MKKLQKAIKNKKASVEAYAWCNCPTCVCASRAYSTSYQDFYNKGKDSSFNK